MYCSNCGAKVNDRAKFCSQCGTSIKSVKSNFISIRCEDCGGMMTVDEDRTIISCPYCGSAKLVNESDAVRIQRIKSKSEKETVLGREEIRASAEKEEGKNNAIIAKVVFVTAGGCVLLCFIMVILANVFSW